eukprot:Seg566.2 transcript_id=Seg566.2/GoldUCD/mRNA.D3Y31 product="hypothetical protein" protein_id=Seg566.2/GoldUCD/D3Y31
MIAKDGKLKRYQNRNNQYDENCTLQNNEGGFYKQLNGQMSGSKEGRPNGEKVKRIWSDIWDNPKEHRSDAKWLKDLREELCNVKQQEDLNIEFDY